MKHKIGLVVPSSNTTVETEMPALLSRHPDAQFSFHSSRMRMQSVSPEELQLMNSQRQRCVQELSDANPDVLLYACLVALMASGPGEHQRVEEAIEAQLVEERSSAVVRSSAGALVEALHAMNASRIALVTPYMRPLAAKVVEYLEAEGFDIADWRALEVADNFEVGRIPGDRVMEAARSMSYHGVDALVLSCCVQMPSLAIIEQAELEFSLPVLSAATAGAYSILRALDFSVDIADAGSLLRADGAPARIRKREDVVSVSSMSTEES